MWDPFVIHATESIFLEVTSRWSRSVRTVFLSKPNARSWRTPALVVALSSDFSFLTEYKLELYFHSTLHPARGHPRRALVCGVVKGSTVRDLAHVVGRDSIGGLGELRPGVWLSRLASLGGISGQGPSNCSSVVCSAADPPSSVARELCFSQPLVRPSIVFYFSPASCRTHRSSI